MLNGILVVLTSKICHALISPLCMAEVSIIQTGNFCRKYDIDKYFYYVANNCGF
jgi:hypothetical protein